MNKRIAAIVSAVAGILASGSLAAAEEPKPAAPEPLYATVNGTPITQRDFYGAFNNHLRQKYYHGQIPPEQLETAKKEVGDQLVLRVLLLEEAKRRGIAADEQQADKTVAEYDARYAASATWQKSREAMLPGLRKQLLEQDLLRQMEAIGRMIAEPTEEAVREFHKARIELFTEPEKLRLHTILLRVDPSAPKAAWEAAREEATRIAARLRAGEAKFEDLAMLHSNDVSADKGGDMGYLHKGMIPEPVQAKIDAVPLGTVSDPIDVLEGVTLFRLDERIPPKVMPFDEVSGRALELLKREQGKQAWEDFAAGLRRAATITLVEQSAQALPAPEKN